MQVISGVGALGQEGAGVAYAAHVGGFLAGMILVKFFVKKPETQHSIYSNR